MALLRFPARIILLLGQKITKSLALPLSKQTLPDFSAHPEGRSGARTLTFSGEKGEAQDHQQKHHLDSQGHEDEDHEGGAVGCSEPVEVDGSLCPAVAVDCRAGVFAVVAQGPQLLGDAVAGDAAGARGALGGPAPAQGRGWLPLGRASSLEGVVPAGAHRDVNDPGGGCGNGKGAGKVGQAAKGTSGANTPGRKFWAWWTLSVLSG